MNALLISMELYDSKRFGLSRIIENKKMKERYRKEREEEKWDRKIEQEKRDRERGREEIEKERTG